MGIVPMTVVDVTYFDEIVGRSRRDGVSLHHITLMTSRGTILARY
jgi:hypothetical protein